MKKYLLLGIITLAGIFNFSSAETYYGMSFTCAVGGQINGYNECGDDSLEFDPYIEGDYVLNISTTLNSFEATILVGNGYFNSNNKNIIAGTITPGNYNFSCNDDEDEKGCMRINPYSYLNTIGDTPALITYTVSQVGGEGGEGGNIVEGGINAFSGIIDRVGNIFGEFGPYIIYIAIACLGISLLFKALKYILGFTNNSAKNSIGGRLTMQERRTQRRRLRRMKNKGYNYRYNYYINEGIKPQAAKEQANYMVKNRNRIGKKYGFRR